MIKLIQDFKKNMKETNIVNDKVNSKLPLKTY